MTKANCDESFDIPACYKMRGWRAILVQGNTKKVLRFVRGRDLDKIQVITRAKDLNYDEVQRVW